MFGGSYSRKKFWIITFIAFLTGAIIITPLRIIAEQSQNAVPLLIAQLIIGFILINSLTNRIRDYGSNPWLALWSLIPVVGLFQGLYFGIKHKKLYEPQADSSSKQIYQSVYSETPELKRYSYQEKSVDKPQSESASKQSKSLKRLN